MKTLRTVAASFVLLGLLSQTALAGGGKNATIKVFNTSTSPDVLAVIVDGPDGAISDLSLFLRSGGKFLQAGQNMKYSVSAGTHMVHVRYISGSLGFSSSVDQPVGVGKGKTANFWVAGDHNSTPPLWFVN
jgi:hypothetical protein